MTASASGSLSSLGFSYNGRPVFARAGDTVASALYRAGVRIFSRSFKYHRPRGLLCAAGRCPNCLMNVDGIPNVRACTTPVHKGMQVRHQNAYPSPEFDLLAALQWFGWLMPVGFYYKTFTKPFVWRRVEPWIRRAAGLGVIRPTPDPRASYEHVYLHVSVAVIGGGPAGMAAAAAAARAGASVLLIDEQPELGGHLRDQRRSYDGLAGILDEEADGRAFSSADIIGRLRAQLAGVEVITNATCIGLYEGGLLAALQRASLNTERLIHLRAGRIVVATGAYEVPLVFENNDLPGIMLSTAVQRLANRHGLKLADSAVVVSREKDGGQVAEDLRASDVRVIAVVPPSHVVAAKGRKHVLQLLAQDRRIDCDLIVLSGARMPDAGLLTQAGAKLLWSEAAGAFLPTGLPQTVLAAGRVTGADGLRATLLQGRRAGIQAAQSLAGTAAGGGGEWTHSEKPAAPGCALHFPLSDRGKSFVCLCEDVTVRDLRDAIVEGFDHIETLKRYTTVTMGPCQGRMCQLASIGICAQQAGQTMGGTGTTTARPPTTPISLGALAGVPHHPVKRTPMHSKHDELRCVWTDMGEWKRPLYYLVDGKDMRGCVEEEYRAVRERVGIIDLSTLGKLDVKGKDAPPLLDKVYTNRLSNLRVGRVRYSVICDDAGIILDDGTISRASEDRFFITTTTGNIEFVQQWMEWWAIGTAWCVHVTNVTGGFAAINVAGPMARALLHKLTDCDLSAKAFPYMGCAEADVAGVPCFLLRIGFVGETGWEIHFPADYGEYLWDTMFEAGREFDVRPFGVETQRLLRLEKKHIIVGVDTDATSNPLDADMEWVAKLDKEDFVGKAAILRAQGRAAREKLVGFVMLSDAVPEDGAAIAIGAKPVGRVTSARYSPGKGKAIGMAWVAAGLAGAGQEIQVQVRGRFAGAQIEPDPFYDPEGLRLRS